MKPTFRSLALPIVAVLMAHSTLAHSSPGGTPSGLFAGLLHPLLGLDHLLTMLGVGIWAAQIGARALWTLPLACVTSMLAGAAVGAQSGALPLGESGILLSLVLLGVAIAAAIRGPLGVPVAAVGLFSLLHGHAHGAELAAGLSPQAYAFGLTLTTASLNAAGIGLALATRRWASAAALRYAGGCIALCGMLLGSRLL